MLQSLKINEIFYSIDGEGKRAGELAAFIRLTGCNLRCSYCDTCYAMNEGCLMSIAEIVKAVENWHNITITGGEPLNQDIRGLLNLLYEHEVNIETNGSVDISPYFQYKNVFFTIDYKLPSSGMSNKMLEDNFIKLRECDVLKFVVSDIADMDAAKDFYNRINPKCAVYFSPVYGQIEPSTIVEYMKENNLQDWRLQLQLHKIIWEPEKRGV